MAVPRDNPPAIDSSASFAEPWRQYAVAMLDRIGCELRQDGVRLIVQSTAAPAETASEAEPARRWGGGLSTRRRKQEAETATSEFEGESPSELFSWLTERLESQDKLPCFTPTGEPHAVHEFAHPMFEAYQVDGGAIHLGGCHLEDVPLLRLTSLDTSGPAPRVRHAYFDRQGAALPAELIKSLQLTEVAPPAEPKPSYQAAKWSPGIQLAKESLAANHQSSTQAIPSIVLAKRAEGRLQVTIDEESLDIPFCGWTRTLTAPPAICPETKQPTFHLAALEDGRIVAAESIGRCEASNQAMLQSDLVICAGSGQRVAKQLTEPCPVLRKPVLSDQFVICPTCGERVAPTTLLKDTCIGCDQTTRVAGNDARLGSLLKSYPELSSYKTWKVSETESALIFRSRRLMRQLLIVVDRSTGQIKQAKWRRLLGRWSKISIVDNHLVLA